MPSKSPRAFFWKAFAGAAVILSLLSGIWSVATPIGASPDEPAHLIKAASVARGQLIGERGSQGEIVQVPQYIAFTHAQTCFAFNSSESAACMPEVPGDPAQLVDAPTTAGLYNPLYYVLVGWPSLLFDDSTAIFAMRLVSSVLVASMLGLAFALICSWRRPALPLLGFAVAITPMVLFLGGAVNPNGLEIAATLASFVAIITILRNPASLYISLGSAVFFVAAALAANMRGLSLLWLAVAVLTPLVLTHRRHIRSIITRPAVLLAIGGVGAAVACAGIWLLKTNSLGAALEDPLPTMVAPATGASPFDGFIWTFLSTFHYAYGIVGVFGWLDTPAPELVYFAWSLLAGGLVFLGVTLLRGRLRVLALILTIAVAFLPPLLQAAYIQGGGIIWQGRYILPLFVCLVVACALGLSETKSLAPFEISKVCAAAIVLWAAAQFYAFATALRRYATGLDEGWMGILHPEWTPAGGIWPVTAAFGLVCAGAGIALYLVIRRVLRAPVPTTDSTVALPAQ